MMLRHTELSARPREGEGRWHFAVYGGVICLALVPSASMRKGDTAVASSDGRRWLWRCTDTATAPVWERDGEATGPRVRHAMTGAETIVVVSLAKERVTQ